MTNSGESAIVVETMASQPWASLTFAGERHHVVVRVPAAPVIDGANIRLRGAIVAVEASAWDAASARLTIDLLVLDDPGPGA